MCPLLLVIGGGGVQGTIFLSCKELCSLGIEFPKKRDKFEAGKGATGFKSQ